MGKIRVKELSGSFYEMGYEHGKAYAEAIHKFTEERVKLSTQEGWTGRNYSEPTILALAEACVDEHKAYSPELMEELQGMADATNLSLAELIINNGFTDFIDVVYNVGPSFEGNLQTEHASDNCTAFLVPDSITHDKNAMIGQTWDMHATATPYVILLEGKPDDAPNFLVFTVMGCVGMLGMNDAGISVGINNILGGDGQIGVTWPFVIRKILMQTNIDDALECVTSAKLAGAHNYLLMDRDGNGYNIEAMSTRHHIQKLEEQAIVHTNHCIIGRNLEVERERAPKSLESSKNRLVDAGNLLNQTQITPEMLMALTRDANAICVRAEPPLHIESCGAAIMQPATGKFWAVWGLPTENEYELFQI